MLVESTTKTISQTMAFYVYILIILMYIIKLSLKNYLSSDLFVYKTRFFWGSYLEWLR